MKDKQAYQTGPAEFVDYINSASAVFTDSFHGVAFSILLETPFVVYERVGSLSMYSRIETILRKLGLEQRDYRNTTKSKQIFNTDFSLAHQTLREERNKTIKFLSTNFDIEI